MKKSLRPQQAAPVQRETTATSTASTPSTGWARASMEPKYYPFAGEDAE
ncbi:MULTISPECIES: anacyclamide/piricyclamide family prenylated cyclic peptide [unclassified Microcoleus]